MSHPENTFTLTPIQYCYPYVFDMDSFAASLQPFGLQYKLEYDTEFQFPKPLQIFNDDGFNLSIEFYNYLIFDGNSLVVWNINKDNLKISKFHITATEGIAEEKLDISLSEYNLGVNDFDHPLDRFVTYIKRNDLK